MGVVFQRQEPLSMAGADRGLMTKACLVLLQSIPESLGAVWNSCLWEAGRGWGHSGRKTADAGSEAGRTIHS